MNNRALTLVELLIAVGLVSLIMASVTGLLRASATLQQGFEATASTTHSLERALEQLSQDLEQAQVFFGIPFEGTEQSLVLARVEPAQDERGVSILDWFKVVYRVESDEAGLRLIREEVRVRAPEEPVESRIVLSGLKEARFDFGWRNPATKTIEWKAPWPELEGNPLPGLVRFHGELMTLQTAQPVRLERLLRNPAGVIPEESS